MPKPARKLKTVPQFRSDERRGRSGCPSTATISLRLPQALLEELRVLANERDVPYQSLLKVYLAERIAQERRPARVGRRASVGVRPMVLRAV